MADIESVYGAWCMESIRVRWSRRLYKLGTGDLAIIGRAHYHRPWINVRMYFKSTHWWILVRRERVGGARSTLLIPR